MIQCNKCGERFDVAPKKSINFCSSCGNKFDDNSRTINNAKEIQSKPTVSKRNPNFTSYITEFAGIDWRVLDISDGKALLITEEVIKYRSYNKQRMNITWEQCDLRKYLNGEFYNNLGSLKSEIADTDNSNSCNPWYETVGGNATIDKIFLLSLDEVCRYFGEGTAELGIIKKDGIFTDINNPERTAKGIYSGIDIGWWLRSPGMDASYAAYVDSGGSINVCGRYVDDSYNDGVRPALWLTISSPNTQPKPKKTVDQQQSIADTTTSMPQIGSTYYFANQDWRVLDIQNDKALLLGELVITRKYYHEPGGYITWEDCTLRNYLNGEFYNQFSDADKKRIHETMNGNPDNHWYGTVGGKDTLDKIFILSLEEVDKFFGDSRDYLRKQRKAFYAKGKYTTNNKGHYLTNENDSNRIAYDTNGREYCWWLRSPGESSSHAAYVSCNGRVCVPGNYIGLIDGLPITMGARPALWIDISTHNIQQQEQTKVLPQPVETNIVQPQSLPTQTEVLSQPATMSSITNFNRRLGSIQEFAGINWRVLEIKDDKALLISENVIEVRPYNNQSRYITWEQCDLRQYLNGEFYNNLGVVKNAIADTRNPNYYNPWFRTDGGNATTDRVFLLSLVEVCRYFGDSTLELKRVRKDVGFADQNNAYRLAGYGSQRAMWWLRSPGDGADYASYIHPDGHVILGGIDVSTVGGVRPALWVLIKT